MAATAKPGLATLVADDTSEHAVSLYPGSDKVRQAVLDFLTKHSAGTS